MLRTLLDLIRAGAMSTAVFVVKTGGAVSELVSALSRRFGASMQAPRPTVNTLYNRADQAVFAANQYAVSDRPAAGSVPSVPSPTGETGISTRVNIRIEELFPDGTPTGEQRFHRVVISSQDVLTQQELRDAERELLGEMEQGYPNNESFVNALRRWGLYRTSILPEYVIRFN